MPDQDRLHRSELAVPASNLRLLGTAPAAGTDVVFLDLEDAVAPADLELVALLLRQIERARSLEPFALTALIETAPGIANVERIAECCPDRFEALVFGVGDYAASTRARTAAGLARVTRSPTHSPRPRGRPRAR